MEIVLKKISLPVTFGIDLLPDHYRRLGSKIVAKLLTTVNIGYTRKELVCELLHAKMKYSLDGASFSGSGRHIHIGYLLG